MTFRDLHSRLLLQLRSRVRNGEVTERVLARQVGISQPHMNNVLKGRKTLSYRLADTLLKYFNISLLDLVSDNELRAHLWFRTNLPCQVQAPMYTSGVGPGPCWSARFLRSRLLSVPFVDCANRRRLALARLRPDPRMPATSHEYDLTLIDTSVGARKGDSPESLFVICLNGDARLRWIRSGAEHLYLADEFSLSRPSLWEPIRVNPGEILRYIKGRVVWLGMEKSLIPPITGHAYTDAAAPPPPRQISS